MSYPLSTCEQPDCPGHLGKFDSCEAEAIYELSMDDHANSVGDGDWHGWWHLCLLERDEVVTIDPDGEDRKVSVPAGNYILRTYTTGAVSLWTYDTAAQAQAEWSAAQAEWIEWETGDEGVEAAE